VANLLDNARKATGPDGHIAWLPPGRRTFAELLVTTTAKGVPAPDRTGFRTGWCADNARDAGSAAPAAWLGCPIAVLRPARTAAPDLRAPPPAIVVRSSALLPNRVDPRR